MLELHASLLAEWPSLGDGLSAANTPFEARADAHAPKSTPSGVRVSATARATARPEE